ncbi:hypothetical protein [Microbacterium rhizomatis]|uniref:PBP domain-containing protein n=1 Tax=Microbacterium rhizomatis TaxID=1631477 RepID=A0A5J5J853_9MICO|nr:hypothetical protein [Microbacterium rhizomatis]KAA9110983.1 hypothetical protein F6B43_05020 [Microbacterium rhizomatis]
MLRARRRTWFTSGISGLLTAGAVFALVAGSSVAFSGAARAVDDSAKTITAKGQDPDLATAPMPDLSVTVAQTQDLLSQGIRLTWTGGKKSIAPSAGGNGGENFLQIFMCWGDDPQDASRPDRTTCQYGGAGSVGATRDGYRNYPLAQVPAADLPYTAPSAVPFLPPFTSIPFVARDGTRVDGIKTDPVTGVTSIDDTVDPNNNQFFSSYTTNEIPWVGSGNDGKGSVTFEAQTAVQSNGLGCGAPVTVGGTTKGADCWLVVLPRGTSDNGSTNITQSGLFIDSWRHALSVKLEFAPVGSRCPIGGVERQIAGSELAAIAVNSWQPVVCIQAGGSAYALLTGAESDAAYAAASTVDAPLALTSRPLKTAEGNDPLQYAAVALTGVTISVAIDRFPNPNDPKLPPEHADAARSAFTRINLTPRLVAKLLSYSYRSAIPTGANTSYLTGTNGYNITEDPDFLAVNDPEWAAQSLSGPAIADVIVPQGRSDSARAVWAYIAADQDARDFLASKPDPWGMIVNPWYSTDASVNPTGTAFELDREDFPKADPIEYTPKNQGPLNLITWRPYANDLSGVAYLTLRGDAQGPGGWDPNSVPPKYGKSSRMLPGAQRLIGLTSTAAAARYRVVTASLRNPAGRFVDPTASGMLAASAAMSPSGADGRVLGFDSGSEASKSATDAYPLTMPVYAANNPAKTSAPIRAAYASFIRYAVSSEGQTLGVEAGQLPDGYATIPADWAAQSLAAADSIERGPTPPTAASSPPAAYIPSQTPASATRSSAAAAPDAAAAAPASPSATGNASPALSGGKTPVDPDMGAIALAVPASVLGGALGAAVVPLITRLRRRVP